MEEKYIKKAILQAYKAYKKNDIPVGAVIVYKDKIIAKTYNKKNFKHNCLYHAEILCINKACKKLKNKYLKDCVMYVTLEPCEMCMAAILESKIKSVIYIMNNKNNNLNCLLKKIGKVELKRYKSKNNYELMFDDMFKKIRNRR